MAVRPHRLLRLSLAALVLGFWAWNFFTSLAQLRESRVQWELLRTRRAVLQERVREMRLRVLSLERDREARVQAARQLLGVCRPQEVVVIVPER